MERPSFDADSAYAYVAAQCGFGPRVPNTEAHRRCSRYIIETLRSFCDTVYVQEFTVRAYDGTMLKAKNIIGSFNPQLDRRVFAAAHWDSRPYADHDPNPANHRTPIDGANDGASGIGVLSDGVDLSGTSCKPGDKVIVSGTLGDHGITIMSCRESLSFSAPVESDAAPHSVASI